jgi:UDP-N-acetylglucosamine 4,6-dehydratase/5-epimerase
MSFEGFDGKKILITGGTGSFGQYMVKTLLEQHEPARIIVLSRDEWKQSEMQKTYDPRQHSCLRYFIGDVRDLPRLKIAFHGVDYVIHAAALKQIGACEYNPYEAIKTNVIGGQNVVEAAVEAGVKLVVALSTDKAAAPVNLYGATKLCSDKLIIAANQMGAGATKTCVVRYGNVFGSRGSVVPLFLQQKQTGNLTVTDERMTRFTISLSQGVQFVIDAFKRMQGGELFIPKLPSYRIKDVATAIAPEAKIEITGIRPGEKLHECMIPGDESYCTLEYGSYYVIYPPEYKDEYKKDGKPVSEGFEYSSGTNTWWLSVEQLREQEYLEGREKENLAPYSK